jgi:hypothetical protein
MTGHGRIRALLYDYVRGELGAGEAHAVGEHLGRCPRCAREAADLRSLLDVVPDGSKRPSSALPDSYWTGFANEVMGRLGDGTLPGRARPGPAGLGFFGRIPATARRASLAAAVVAIAVALYVMNTRPPGETGPASTGSVVASAADTLSDFDRRLSDYFRRSKTLLVGVSNDEPMLVNSSDIETERRTSRSLLEEARSLRAGPIDLRSAKLIDDLDQIMIGLANSKAGSPSPAVDLIRVGIRDKNLLFKLRMHETRRFGTPVRQASYHQ